MKPEDHYSFLSSVELIKVHSGGLGPEVSFAIVIGPSAPSGFHRIVVPFNSKNDKCPYRERYPKLNSRMVFEYRLFCVVLNRTSINYTHVSKIYH